MVRKKSKFNEKKKETTFTKQAAQSPPTDCQMTQRIFNIKILTSENLKFTIYILDKHY